MVHRHEPPVTSTPVKILVHDEENEIVVIDKQKLTTIDVDPHRNSDVGHRADRLTPLPIGNGYVMQRH